MSTRIIALIMNKNFIWAPKITRQMVASTIWICWSSCTNCVLYISYEKWMHREKYPKKHNIYRRIQGQRNLKIKWSYHLVTIFAPEEFTPKFESEVWINDVALLWHPFPPNIVALSASKRILLVWESDLQAWVQSWVQMCCFLKGILEPKFLESVL